jgi:putative ABC transport system permease protein
MTTKTFHRDWFTQLQQRLPEVQFVVPMTRQISSSVVAANKEAKLQESLSLMATAPGDPLLMENSAPVPDTKSCVLTAAAAQSLSLQVGDVLEMTAQRIIGGKYEYGRFSVQLAGILDERASGLKTAYVPLSVIEAVEDFKDGRAVPGFGWKGELPTAYPVYEGAMVLVQGPLNKLDQVLLINNTGFSQVKPPSPEEAEQLASSQSLSQHAYLLKVKHRYVTQTNLRAVQNKLRGKGAKVLPWIRPLAVQLQAAQGDVYALRLSVMPEDRPGASTGKQASGTNPAGGQPVGTVFVSEQLPLAAGLATLRLQMDGRELELPVWVEKHAIGPDRALAEAEFAGALDLFRYRDLSYNSASGSLLLSRQGYAGFRLYTATIDAVESVQRAFEAEGIAVNTERQRIAEVKQLDHYTSLIFWLIAAVGVVGGISALTASLYASVERKKKELNVLRLLGLLKKELVLFPIAQGLLLSSGALVLSVALFQGVAQVINQLFQEQLRSTESLCILSAGHFFLLFVGVWSLSIIAATFAALRATRLDPAEALRDE